MNTWNHRVVKMDDEEGTLLLAEVIYDENGNPLGYHEPFMSSDTIEGLQELITRLGDALEEPVLDVATLQWNRDEEDGDE
jgi:hypothetical protein